MSIEDNYTPNKSLGNGATVDFSGSWSPLNEDYMRVYLEVVATGVQTLQTLNTDYTLVFDSSGYTVTMTVAPSSSYYVLRSRVIPIEQTSPFRTSRGWQGGTIEDSLDKVTAVAQQIDETLTRSLSFAIGSSSTAIVPEPSDGKVLGWDGTDLANLTPNTSTYLTVSTFMETVIDDTTSTAAKTTLNILPQSLATAASAAYAEFAEDTDNGTNKVTLIAPASIASDAIVTLPNATATVATVALAETLANKTISAASNTFNLTPITNSLGADVALNNTANYFDGPSIAQGTSGTWFVSGTISLIDTAGTAQFQVKLWDGTTVIASTVTQSTGDNLERSVSLSGYLASPAGNLRISAKDVSSTSGKILYNQSGNSKDSTISAIRIG